MTLLRIATTCCLSTLFLGCNAGQTPVGDEAASPLISYRAGDGFDSAKRVFASFDMPMMPTMIHAEYVEEFVNRPGFGGQRMVFIPRTRPHWTELVPESED